MLVLSRKKNERIQIGDNIWITVVDIRGDKVRIGIDCPKSISILREEVAEQMRDERGELRKIPNS